MTSTRPQQWNSAYESVAGALETALDPNETRGQRVQRLLDTAAARGAVNAALADAFEQWNAAHPDALLRLPTELVHATFRLLVFRDRITVSHVSRGWRTTALADPFLWNVARFVVDRRRGPLVYYPPPGRPDWKPPPRPPPQRTADILRELLTRSEPAPFTLTWENQRPAQLPDEMVELVLGNIHRMHELTIDLSDLAFVRLFALPAPVLHTLSCTVDSAPCDLPARWDAPVLQKLELGVVGVHPDAQPLPSVEVFICRALRGPVRPFELFPALASLYIEEATPEIVCCLGEPPLTLVELTLRTEDAALIDYAPLLAACGACKLELLRLESSNDLAPALELFTRAVKGAWSLKVGRAGRHVELLAEGEEVKFEIHLAAPLSLARESRIAQHLDRLAALSADVTLLAQMTASEHTLPALRVLTLEFTQRPQWLSSSYVRIRVPMLEEVSVLLDAEAEAAAHWVAEAFPEILKSQFAYDRPLLTRISIEADADTAQGLEERSLAGLRALAECVRVDVGGATTEYGHVASSYRTSNSRPGIAQVNVLSSSPALDSVPLCVDLN